MVHSWFETIVLLYHDWEWVTNSPYTDISFDLFCSYKVIMILVITNDHPAEDDDVSESELGQGQYTNEEKKIVIGERTKRKEILILVLPYHTGSSVRALRHQTQHRKEGGGVWIWCYVITEGGCQSLIWLHGDRFDLLWWWEERCLAKFPPMAKKKIRSQWTFFVATPPQIVGVCVCV